MEQLREVALWVTRQSGIEVVVSGLNSTLSFSVENKFLFDQDLSDELERLAETLVDGIRKTFDLDADYEIECGQVTIEVLQ